MPQKGVLFTGTIESNILYGCPEAGPERAQAAAATAQAADFIGKKEEGYQSEIAQGGTNVSGGQKQRLAIARALAVKPEVYVFDDSFSALDYQTDAALRRALKEETAGATLIIGKSPFPSFQRRNWYHEHGRNTRQSPAGRPPGP